MPESARTASSGGRPDDTHELDRARSLAGVSLFAGVDNDLKRKPSGLEGSPWADLASAATPAKLAAGEWLWHEGDPGDSLYVVLTGRLEVVIEGAEPRAIRVLGRGEAVGELALLNETPRSAGVRAARDSELLRVDRADFEEVMERRPEFARSLTRVLGSQLQNVRATAVESDPLPSTIALVPLGPGLPMRDLGRYLVLVLSAWRKTLGIDATGGDEHAEAFGAKLDRAERENEQVVLVASEPDPADVWTSFCVRQADRVVAVAAEGADRPAGVPQGCDLLVLADDGKVPALGSLVRSLDPRGVHIVRSPDRRAPVIEQLARRLAGRSLGLVLSGGGARAFAHIGVLAEIEARGLEVDRVGGTSGGAYIGAQYAFGRSSAEILDTCRREFLDDNPLNEYTLPIVSVVRNRKGLTMLARVFGDARIEELERDFFCVSCDMLTGEQVIHRRGRVAAGVGASMTLPGILPPFVDGDRLLLDGGVLNNLPVDVMAAAGEGPIVAVDVSARFEAPERGPSRFRRRRLAELARRGRNWIVGSDAVLPGFGETITRSIVLGAMDTAAAAQRYADVVIAPEVGDYGMLDWDRIDDLVEAGRSAARAALLSPAAAVLSD